MPVLTVLAQNGHFKDEKLVNYLAYLQYWKDPQYAKYLKYVKHSIKNIDTCSSSRVV